MNRRTFFSFASSILAAVGLTAAAVSVAEGAEPGPIPGLCDTWQTTGTRPGRFYASREACVTHQCHKESGQTDDRGRALRNWQVWGYSDVKACEAVNE